MEGQDLELLRKANEIELTREAKSPEVQRRKLRYQMSVDAERVYEEMMMILAHPDTDPKIKMQIVNIVLDRVIPRLGVEHVEATDAEEAPSRKGLREELEALIEQKMREQGE